MLVALRPRPPVDRTGSRWRDGRNGPSWQITC